MFQSELPIEVVNVMNWHLDHPFVLSASLHGGALVTSYPMDACDAEGREADCPSEDDPLPLKLARAVADAHGRMSHMASAHSSFDRGVTRGSEWSPILGSMQVRTAQKPRPPSLLLFPSIRLLHGEDTIRCHII